MPYLFNFILCEVIYPALHLCVFIYFIYANAADRKTERKNAEKRKMLKERKK